MELDIYIYVKGGRQQFLIIQERQIHSLFSTENAFI